MSAGFWNLSRIAAALGTGPRGDRRVARIITDSRTLESGDVFVALRGETFDGHDFLPEVVARGAAAAVVSRVRPEARLGVPLFEVPDTLAALGQLARYWRDAWNKPVIAVAGSNGKTSTKDLIAAALGARLRVHATTGNLNNRIGVPLTLLAAPPTADIAVVEVGTSLPGEVATLRGVTRPDIAVVTSVGEEHLEGLGDMAGVLAEEAAIYDGCEVAIAPAFQPEIVAEARARGRSTIAAGLEEGDLRADGWSIGPDGLGEIRLDGVSVRPPLRGVHNLRNAMLAFAAARACGVGFRDAARAIEVMAAPRMRSAWQPLGRAILINDAYNANPGSTRAAIQMLAAVNGGRQRVAVLGTMRELGPRSPDYHVELARLALDSADLIAGIGDFAAALEQIGERRENIVTAPDVGELWAVLEPRLSPDAVILLKASRGVRLERLVPHLEEWAARVA